MATPPVNPTVKTVPLSTAVKLTVRKKPETTGKVAVFAIVRNERYFLPHLLDHYRRLGVKEFWFHDDDSDDGTLDYLMAQPDCGVTASAIRFGDKVADQGGEMTFGFVIKSIVPRRMLFNRWVLTVDADEFLVLPEPYETLDQLVEAMERNKLVAARALMMDFYPATLREAEEAPVDQSPFEVSPYFDAWSKLVWPEYTPNVSEISVQEGVRPRLLRRLVGKGADLGQLLQDYRYANVNKTPLVYWHGDIHAVSAHRVTINASDRVQLVFAHFKFYPGHVERSAHAVKSAVHWQGAVEYRILDVANRELMDWPLQGPRTRRYTGPKDLMETGLLYSRLE